MKESSIERTKKLALTALFAALIAIGAFLRVPIPTVPFTLQFLFANMAVLFLGKKWGTVSVLIYVAIGLVGIPIFTKGGGFSYVLQPTFGYLIGFAIGNFAAGVFLERRDRSKHSTLIIAGFINLVIVYALGMIYYYFIAMLYLNSPITLGALVLYCCLATLWSDVIFVFFTAFLAKRVNKLLKIDFADNPKLTAKLFAKKVLNGHGLTKSEALALTRAPLKTLAAEADKIRKKFCGNAFYFCTICNVKCGKCSEDCKYCAQSGAYPTETETYGLVHASVMAEHAERFLSDSVTRFSAVSSGRMLSGVEVESLSASAVEILKNKKLNMCVSAGLLQEADFLKLKEAGVTRIHNNLETSERFFSEICSSHTYQDKLDTIAAAKNVGLEVCSGGIFGLGETWNDRIDFAFKLSNLAIASVPINILNPIHGTPFAERPILKQDEVVRIVAIFRFLLPKAQLRLAGGRGLLPDRGECCFRAGANAAITGDMLTTNGISVAEDTKIITKLGFILSEDK